LASGAVVAAQAGFDYVTSANLLPTHPQQRHFNLSRFNGGLTGTSLACNTLKINTIPTCTGGSALQTDGSG